MEIQLLVLHRKESYPGQYAPEVVAVVDEVTLMENPGWWEDEVATHKAEVGEEAAAWAVVSATLDGEALMKLLYPHLGQVAVAAAPGEFDGS